MALVDVNQSKCIEVRLTRIENVLSELEAVWRVKRHLLKRRVSSAVLKVAPRDCYYHWTLQERAAFLDCNIEHLCKSIIVENTAYAKKSINHAYGGRYLCIIVQYQEKLDAEQLSRFVCALVAKETGIAVARKYFSFQHAPKDVCAERTGFEHNGVSPFGSKQFFPVIASEEILKTRSGYVWLGGGAPNFKLKVATSQLVRALDAQVAPNITRLRIN
ncbi:unnamed protein product [Albugo candida]|uniref:YbaK/aminoacyl-tRNA synthetase-associated domain-containing protein n=1 Tax=Albugo candida TaxID=65357 RepID=A0A024GNN1_9STRA|nr:unnamed protein product [Albugo candida]|eukprot:CCI48346.1 unnamed protein product [Albugo candida]